MVENAASKEKRRKRTEEQNARNRAKAAANEAAGGVADSRKVQGRSNEQLRTLAAGADTGETVGQTIGRQEFNEKGVPQGPAAIGNVQGVPENFTPMPEQGKILTAIQNFNLPAEVEAKLIEELGVIGVLPSPEGAFQPAGLGFGGNFFRSGPAALSGAGPRLVNLGTKVKASDLQAASKFITDPSTAQLVKDFAAKAFTLKTALWAGGILAGAYSAWIIGNWGQAESPESTTFTVNKYAIDIGRNTGNWTLFDEGIAASEEVTDLTVWEEALLATPLAPVVGVLHKLDNTKKGVKLLKDVGNEFKRQQEAGETEADSWRKVKELEDQMYRDSTDYNNEQKLITQEALIELNKQANIEKNERTLKSVNAQIALWNERDAKQRKLAEEDRIAIAEYWLNYTKLKQEILDESRPSQLGFGLL